MGILDMFTGGGDGGGGLLSGLQGFAHNNSTGLLGLSSGLLSGQGWNQGLSQGFQGFAQGNAYDRQRMDKDKQKKAMDALLAQSKGLSPEMQNALATNPQLAQTYVGQQLAPKNYGVIQGADGNMYSYDQSNPGDFKQVGPQGIAKTNASTEDMKNFAFAKQNGYQGDFVTFQQDWTGNSGAKQDPRIKGAPPGFMWKDPNDPSKGLSALPDGPATKLTAEQAKAAGFADRAANSHQIISQIDGPSGQMGASFFHGNGHNSNVFMTGEGQQYEQAKRDFVNAVLRNESGAVISDAEFENAQKQYFPQIGDTPAVVAQKAKNRMIAVQSLQNQGAGFQGGNGGGASSGSDPLGIR